VHNETRYREGGKVAVETYYCPLRKRTQCPVQIRVTRSVTSVLLAERGRVVPDEGGGYTGTKRFKEGGELDG
jgi:hypothetical protein